MGEQKIVPTDHAVIAFLQSVEPEQRRKDCFLLSAMMERVTGTKPRLWSNQVVGFGIYHYRYPTGREGKWFITGFSPRKQNLSIHILSGFDDHPELMKELGKHKTGRGCLYVKKLEDINLNLLEELLIDSFTTMKKRFTLLEPIQES